MALSLGERSFTHGSEWMRLGFGLDDCLVGDWGLCLLGALAGAFISRER